MATTVKYGSRGDDVVALQNTLNQYGYGLDADGIFGDKTLAAVKQYQQANGLTVDGIVGANTWGALTGGGGSGSGGGYSMSGVTENPNYTYEQLLADLNRSTYTQRSEDQLLSEAKNRYDPLYNSNVLSTQQSYDSILQALDQQLAGLTPAYDKQRTATAEAFAGTYAQADRQALSRGMQRSSFNNQTLANIGVQGAKAQDEINAAQVRDETNIGQNRSLQQQQLAQTLRQLEMDYQTNLAAYQDQLRNQDYDRAWQSQQAANQAALNLYELSLQQYQFEKQMTENARQFDAGLAASTSKSSGSGGSGSSKSSSQQTAQSAPNTPDYLSDLFAYGGTAAPATATPATTTKKKTTAGINNGKYAIAQ